MPVATLNFKVDATAPDAPIFSEGVPMPLDVCGECGLIQIRFVCNPEIQYRDYVYTTTLSLGLPDYFVRAARHLVDRLVLKSGSRVVEFGSNDGTYLRAFRSLAMEVVGADPARRIASAATAAGVPTYPEFFDETLAGRIVKEYGKADLLLANNVIANIDELQAIFRAVKLVLASGGAFVFETQYGRDVLDKYLLDTVYHEHLTYFTVAPLATVLGRFGLAVFDAEHIETKGGSIRVYVQHAGGPRVESPSVRALTEAETREAIYSQDYFDRFAAGIAARRAEILRLVDATRAAGQKVAGYGASVGTATLLAQFGLDGKIDFLVDDDSAKPAEMNGPGYRLPIRRPSALIDDKVRLTVIFAWRYADPIWRGNRQYMQDGGRFLVPLPSPHLLAEG